MRSRRRSFERRALDLLCQLGLPGGPTDGGVAT